MKNFDLHEPPARAAQSREYWRSTLLAGSPTALPRWRVGPASGVGEHAARIPVELETALHRLATKLALPFDTLLLAAHAKVLGALTGEQTVCTGLSLSRAAPRPLRVTLAPRSWRDLLHETDRARAEMRAHIDLPVDALIRELGLEPLRIESVFESEAGDNVVLPMDSAVLSVAAVKRRGLCLRLRYDTGVFDAEWAARVADYHRAALALLVADPDAEHARQTLLSEDELRFQLEGLAGRRRDLPNQRVHELIEARARKQPDAIAAMLGDQQRTYRQLNGLANQLARALSKRGLRREATVGVVTERTLNWMTAVLAILKAGGAYLPIEPQYPAERIARMLSRADCRLVLTERGSTATLSSALPSLPEVATLDIDSAIAEGHASDDLGIEVAADQLAYVFFTSGSTGEPKGAMCEHAGLLNHVFAKIDDLQIGAGDVVAQVAPQCFDISLWQLLSAPLAGGRTLLVAQETVLDARRFTDLLVDGGVTVLQVVPSYLEVLLSRLEKQPLELPALRVVSVTGEALKAELVRRWFRTQPAIPLVNAYGLTETSDDTNHEVMDQAPEGQHVPLGRPVSNVSVSVVDEHLAPVPLGAPGEIVFSGVCVGRGYVNDPERTRQRFLDDPYRPGQRMFRSGDLGRWLADGKLEYLGRRDSQVKLSGFRIEIGEIENALLRVPGIGAAAVIVAEGAGGSRRLVAFYAGARPLDGGALRARLGCSLPMYMLPTAFHWRRSLPLTGNGKVDTRSLAAEAAAADVAKLSAIGQSTAAEKRLAGAWAQALGLPPERIGRGDNFFELGGTSLSVLQLAIALDRALPFKELLSHPVLAEQAALLDQQLGPATDEATRAAASDRPAASGIVEQTTAAGGGRQSAAGTPLAVELRSGKPPILRVDAGGEASRWAVENHDALRAVLIEHGSVLVRGLGLRDAEGVEAVFRRLGTLTTEREAFAPRHRYAEGVYSASKWPANQHMCMHHELSYALEVPGLMLFACLVAATEGGETPLADSPTVLAALPRALVERFEQAGWILIRNYNSDIGASVAAAFGSDDRHAVEGYCRANAIKFEWQPDGGLRTWQHRRAVLRHPRTGRRCWFNQIAFLNEWTMEPELREYLVDVYGADGLPFNTRFGDGAAIGPEVVQLIDEAYAHNTASEPWQAGDLLLVDNLRTAHGRERFVGPRKVLVAMADAVQLPACSPAAGASGG